MFFILENNKLIILGNGFDLACGLKSKYADFFKKRITGDINKSLMNAYRVFKREDNPLSTGLNAPVYQFITLFDIKRSHSKSKSASDRIIDYKFPSLIPADKKIISSSNLTFWDIVLFYFQEFSQLNLEDVQWQNIEDRMLDFFTNEYSETPSFKDIYFSIIKNSDLSLLNWLCLYVASILPEREKTYESDDFLQYLYDELRLFEKAFFEYLANEVEKSSEYRNRAVDLLDAIALKNVRNFSKDSVLSFNYTSPISSPNYNITNVHGTLHSGNIIFGIDQTKIDPSKDIYRFTKTFRQMTETSISKRSNDLILPSKEEINEIAFFGHSLSPLDYSYFQTIFDFYDLYSSNVTLAFYYRLYDGVSNLDMELDLSKKISQMLKIYSPSIGNENQANNLMHKLLLEKRLIIEEISL